MNGLMKMVLSLSASGSLTILVLFLCKPFLKNRMGRQWQYYLWLVAVARLLLPLAPEVSLVGMLFQDSSPPAVQVPMAVPPGEDRAPVLPSGGGSFEEEPSAADSEPSAGPPAVDMGVVVSQNLYLVWLGGALALLVRKATMYQSFARYVQAGWEEVSQVELLDRLAQIGAEAGVNRPVELYVNSLVSSPLLLGIFRPCIVLPTASLPENDFTYTIRHELTHLRRRDLLYKWLVQLAVCLHWFNPLAWLMGREISRACELACDEAVLLSLNPEERRAYGDTLLRAVGAGGGYHNSRASAALSESAEQLKERLWSIMNYKKRSKLATVLSLLFAAVLAAGAVAMGAYREPVREAVDASGPFRYTREGYYQAPYLFEIGWNVGTNAAAAYAHTEIPLPGAGEMTVCFTDACQEDLKDEAVYSALSALLARLWRETQETEWPLTCPLVVSVQDIGGTDPASLAAQYYKDGALPQFGAAFAMMDTAGQRAMAEEIYADRQISFFSAAFNQLDAGSPLVEDFAGKAYADENISFFSILANGHMDRETLESWLDRARQDKRASFQSVLLTALGKDQELEDMKRLLEKQLAEEYAACGVTKKDALYYYQGQLVNIFLDLRPNSSFETLHINGDGTINIKVVRGADGKIQAVEQMGDAEAAALLADMEEGDDGEEAGKGSPSGSHVAEIPVAFRSIKKGEVLWLGEFDLDYGDRIWYDVSAEAGSDLQVGFAKPGDEVLDRVYYSVHNRRGEEEGLRCTAQFTVTPSSSVKPGRYQLFLRAAEGDVTTVSGSIAVSAEGDSVASLSVEELPAAVRKAMDHCAVRKWYVLRYNGRQYIRYNGFAWSFGYQPVQTADGWQINIVTFQKKASGEVLLSVPDGELDIQVDGNPVEYTVLDCG